MVSFDGLLTHLDILLQKGIGYKHHRGNFEKISSSGLIPLGLRLRNFLHLYQLHET